MGRIAEALGPLAISRLKEPGLYHAGGVSGLAFRITPSGSRSWVLRAVVAGRRRDHGLGAYPGVSLAMARDLAQVARNKIRAGIDPIEEGRSARSKLKAERDTALTFQKIAEKYIASHRSGWRNAKHADQWTATLTSYAFPIMGSMLIRDVSVVQVMAMLEQRETPNGPTLWESKTETASRLRGRIASVIDYAVAHKYRPEGLNPATWKGHLSKLLPAPSKISKPEHHAALPVAEVGAFMVKLRAMEGVAAKALEFLILTACRSGEVRGALWSEIDMAAKTWAIPSDRMKAGQEHRVPLSAEAIALLKSLSREDDVDLVFVSPAGGALSDMALTAVVRRMEVDCVPHGFRSTFRDWCGERTSYPVDICEAALAHTRRDKTEAAYFRSDLFEKRRALMQTWATFTGKVEVKRDNVRTIGKRA
jgi:integrase